MHEPPTAPAAMAVGNRKRPVLDLTLEPKERKRGKSMFGLVLGTLNKAKIEDKERNASDAVRRPVTCLSLYPDSAHIARCLQAKKRQLIEQRLQDKLRKETDSVRRTEEAKKDKTSANRKEEELQLKDSIVSLLLLLVISKM
jgi:pinin/SDK/memA/ protein conserved region